MERLKGQFSRGFFWRRPGRGRGMSGGGFDQYFSAGVFKPGNPYRIERGKASRTLERCQIRAGELHLYCHTEESGHISLGCDQLVTAVLPRESIDGAGRNLKGLASIDVYRNPLRSTSASSREQWGTGRVFVSQAEICQPDFTWAKVHPGCPERPVPLPAIAGSRARPGPPGR